MMRRAVLLAAAASLGAALSACGEIPQPLRHEETSRLARPKAAMTRGVAVRPPGEGPDGAALAQSLVQALEDQDVAALVQSGPAFGYRIEGRVEDLGPVLAVFWTLKSPDGNDVAASRQSAPKAALAAGDPKALKRTASASAMLLARPLADPDALPDPAEKAAAADARPAVRLEPLRGLPGDGDTALAEAMRRALERAGLAVRADGAAYAVEGKVTIVPGTGGEDAVTVAWVVRRAGGGAELANIGQTGGVPRSRLHQPWGALARDIAEGGASGVLQAVRADGGGKALPKP